MQLLTNLQTKTWNASYNNIANYDDKYPNLASLFEYLSEMLQRTLTNIQ